MAHLAQGSQINLDQVLSKRRKQDWLLDGHSKWGKV